MKVSPIEDWQLARQRLVPAKITMKNIKALLIAIITFLVLGNVYTVTPAAGEAVSKAVQTERAPGQLPQPVARNPAGDLATFINRQGTEIADVELPKGDYSVNKNYILPNSIRLRVTKGATISVSSGVKLTINCPLEAGLYQIFSGPGNVVFMNATVAAVYPQWWGAKGNGVDDDTAAVQAAVDAGKSITFPQGIYRISHIAITGNNKFITGAYTGSVISAIGTQDIFTINGRRILIKDLYFHNEGGARTNGAYIAASGRLINIERCLFENGYYGVLSSAILFAMSDCDFLSFAARQGICIQINKGDAILNKIRMDHSPEVMPACGINITASGATTISDCDLMHCGTDLLINPGNGQVVASVLSSNTFYDTANIGISISPSSGGAVVRCHFINCWASSHANIGTVIGGAGKIDGVTFVNHQANLNGADGVHIFGPNAVNIIFQGGEMAQNLAGAGIAVSGAASKFFLHGVWAAAGFGSKGNLVGINIDKGCRDYEVVNCYCAGNAQGQIVDLSAAGKLVNNTGATTKNSGSSLVSTGQTRIMVNHGLMSTPKPGDIMISPSSNWGGHSLYVNATTINEKTFTVECPGPAPGNLHFSWQASCCGN